MRGITVLTLLCAGSVSGMAAEKLTGNQIEVVLNDSTAWYLPLVPTNARQYFHRNGETPYVSAKGDKTYGEWMVKGDQYCSLWPPSDHWSCYDVEKDTLKDGTPTITFVSGGGGPRYEAILMNGKQID